MRRQITSIGCALPDELRERLFSKIEMPNANDCWLWKGCKNNGYGQIEVPLTRTKMLAHRCMWEILHGAIPPGLVVMHSCDTPLCVNPAHLSLGTVRENNADRDRKGRRSPLMKGNRLSDKDVRDIKAAFALCRVNVMHLAKRFGVTPAAIRYAHRHRAWVR